MAYCLSRNSRNQYYNENNADLRVESGLVGRIIGRNGLRIQDVQANSNTKITILKSVTKHNVSLVYVSGNRVSKMKAKKMLEDLLFVPAENKYVTNHRGPIRAANRNSIRSYNENPGPSFYWLMGCEESPEILEAYWATLPPIYKNFYVESPEVADMTSAELTHWRKSNYNFMASYLNSDNDVIQIIPNPVSTFEQVFQEYPEIMSAIMEQGFTTPTAIQAQAWPIILSGHDLIGVAQTGTGKTLAFLLPALVHIDKQPTPLNERPGPNVLILVPTRELAIQMENEVNKYLYKNFKTVGIYGGADRQNQINEVSKGVQIVIATPGRLVDLVNAGFLNICAVTYLVLDEADRMLCTGFDKQIKRTLLKIHPGRQTVMVSATWPADIQMLGLSYIKNPIQVVMGSLDLTALTTVTQRLLFVNNTFEEKFSILFKFIRVIGTEEKVIVFCGRRDTASNISVELSLKGVTCQVIFGGLDQRDREQALRDVRSGEVNILIATDVASRGIDINDITFVINFDFPHNLEEFINRVGRIGRAGPGKAITYFTRNDSVHAKGLINILRKANQFIPKQLINMAEHFKRRAQYNLRGFGRARGSRNGFARDWEENNNGIEGVSESRSDHRNITEKYGDENYPGSDGRYKRESTRGSSSDAVARGFGRGYKKSPE